MKLLAVLATAALALASTPAQQYGGGVTASCSKIPDDLAPVNRTYVLPDPFRLLNGKRVKTIADWHCRSAQIRELFQACLCLSSPPLCMTLMETSRNNGVFYDLYGTLEGNSTAGALIAWAWATSRIIDSLEQHPEIGIDPAHIAVTGCSRNGKGAMVAGAFDERIALTIPQESGSGGDACWRTSRDMLVNRNLLTQTAQEIVGENVLFAQEFDYVGWDNYTVGLLPVDHHELAGLVAPRGLYSTSNIGFLWLGDFSCWECMNAANRIYEALGVKTNQGFSQDGPHDHRAFPDDQRSEIQGFYDRFLFGKNVDMDVFRTVGNFSFDPRWVPWSTPDLS